MSIIFPTVVRKRDNLTFASYNKLKIIHAVEKAFRSYNETVSNEQLEEIYSGVVDHITKNPNMLSYKLDTGEYYIDVETIQNFVEKSLMEKGWYSIAKNYILYRNQRATVRALDSAAILDEIDGYIGGHDPDEKENSNIDFSLQGLNNNIVAKIMRQYWLERVMTPEAKQMHINGEVHFHDLNLLSVYCCGWDMRALILEGLGGVPGAVSSRPPKEFGVALGQVWNFLYTVQGEAAGAQSLSQFDLYLAPFIRYNNLTYRQVKKSLVKFAHNMNTKTRVGFQTPFTNVSLCLTVPKSMADDHVIYGGKFMEDKYGDFQKEMDIFNQAFCEVMLEGDADGRQFHFPIPTYNITKDFDWDNPNYTKLWELSGKYGAPYFTNYINSELDPDDVRSMCPMRYDTKITTYYRGHKSTMTLEDLYRTYSGKLITDISVTYLGKHIPVKRVLREPTEELIRITTKRQSEGHVFDRRHMQPITRENKPLTVRACDIQIGDLLPYEQKGNIDWVAVTDISRVDKTIRDSYVYCIEVDSEDHLFELTEGDLITHNCRLRLDFTELKNRGGGLFGANSMTGSIGVATLNLPDAAIEANGDKDKLFEILTRRMDIAAQFLDDRRTFIENSIEKGLYPFSRRWLQGIKDKTANDPDIKRPGYYAAYFSTIGIIGGHEMCLNFLGKGIETEEGAKLALEVQEFIKSRLEHYREKYHTPFNLEATPAEGVCYRLAKCLKTKFPTAKMVEELREQDEPYLTNSTALPVGFTNDLYTAITHQSKLQVMYTGGTVFHIFLGEAISNPEAVKEVVRMVCTTTPIPYITLSPEYSICRSHGYLAGEQPECPTCHSDTEVYARVVGFYTPMNRWNKGKRTEGTHRKSFDGIVDVLKIE